MSHQIIKQPNGLFAVWSTIVDDFVLLDATPGDIFDDEMEDAKTRIMGEINRIVKALNETGHYLHFMTWEEAQARRKEIHNDD
jgi:hypothetical protein